MGRTLVAIGAAVWCSASAIGAQTSAPADGWVVLPVDEYKALRERAFPPSPAPLSPPVDAAVNASLRDVCKDVLDTLTPREAKVLRMRFGIEMNTDHTLEEVGKQFDVTRERIRQIEAKALRKLKHPSRSRKLRSFLDN